MDKNFSIEEIPTRDLALELSKRAGVAELVAAPYKEIKVCVDGPAIVLIITD